MTKKRIAKEVVRAANDIIQRQGYLVVASVTDYPIGAQLASIGNHEGFMLGHKMIVSAKVQEEEFYQQSLLLGDADDGRYIPAGMNYYRCVIE